MLLASRSKALCGRKSKFQYSAPESFKCSATDSKRPRSIAAFQYSSSESFKCSLHHSAKLCAVVIQSFSTLHLSRSNAPTTGWTRVREFFAGFSTLHLSRSNAPMVVPPTIRQYAVLFQYSSSESFKCSANSVAIYSLMSSGFSTLHLSRSNAPKNIYIAGNGRFCFSTLHLSRSNAPPSSPLAAPSSAASAVSVLFIGVVQMLLPVPRLLPHRQRHLQFQYSSSESFKCSHGRAPNYTTICCFDSVLFI